MCLKTVRPYCEDGRFYFYGYFSNDVDVIAYTENCTTKDESQTYPDMHFHHTNHPKLRDDLAYENLSFINEIWLVAEPSEIIIKTSLFLPIVLWGLMGNGLLIYILYKNRHIRSPTNLLIGNMAAADLASLLIHPWIVLIYEFFQNYQLGEFGCKVDGTLECTFLLCSVMNLSAISYDRLTAIVLPNETRLTRKSVKLVMGLTWIVGLGIASPLFVYRNYKERQWLDFLEKYCTENTMVFNIYWHVIITMMVWFPLTVLLMCYISIYIKLSNYEKIVLKKFKTLHVHYKKTVAKTMFIIVFTFMVCRLPLTALIFYRNQLLKTQAISSSSNSVQNQVNGVYKILWFTSKLFIFLNAAINPIIYGLMNEKFRKALGGVILTKWIFVYVNKKTTPIIGDKKEPHKETKETSLVPSNKSKVFIISRGEKNNSKEHPRRNNIMDV